MKFLSLSFLIVVLMRCPLVAQDLSITETVSAINRYLEENSINYFIVVDSSYKLKIFENGVLEAVANIEDLNDQVDVTSKRYEFSCKDRNSCFSHLDRRPPEMFSFMWIDANIDTRYIEKIKNASQYLIAKAKSERLLNLQPDNDPFASPIPFYNQTISGKVPLIKRDGGTYELPIILNQTLKQNFILDSGASDVSISNSIFKLLQNSGSVKDADFLQPAYYQFADGSVVLKRRINLKELRIGNYIINDVAASISDDNDAPLLLGQSVLRKLGTISIDYTNHQLIIK
jgi:predicted aspartyl protease